ncbi:MAG: hypothetical protein ACTSWZ_07795 [Candidatus Heimdallarchaeaceae archaeon]
MKRIGMILLFLLVLPSIGYACNAEILSFWYTPEKVNAGDIVEAHTTVRFYSNFGETCSFLLENSIVPQGIPYSTLPLLSSIYYETKCCPANDNFADLTYVMDYCTDTSGCSETKELVQTLKAPTPESYDHCSQDPIRSRPGFYWNGAGYYTITSSVWTGCGGSKYDGRLGLIYVSGGTAICWECDICFGNYCLPLKWGDLVIIIVIVVFVIGLYKYLVKK